MNFHLEERIAIFIDGANHHSASRMLDIEVDYRKLLDHFAGQGRLVRALYYIAINGAGEYSPVRPLVDWLEYNGYSVTTKPIKEFSDAIGRRKLKGNMEVEIAVDMLEMASRVDRIVLFSGDGDFRRLIEAVQREAVRVSVVSTLRSSPPILADELRRQADEFIDLHDLAPQIAREPRPTDGRIPTPVRPEFDTVDMD